MRSLVTSLAPLAGFAEADLPATAILAELGGASAVRIGVNEDLRPVSEANLRDLRRAARRLELRMTPAPAMVKVALETRPDRVVLASEARDHHASAPLEQRAWGAGLPPAVRTLHEAGFDVVMIAAPDLEAVKAAHACDVTSIELHTASLVDLPEAELREALTRLGDAGRLAAKLGMRVGLGGHLDGPILPRLLESLPVAEWATLGRAWVGRAVLAGVDRATRDLRDALG